MLSDFRTVRRFDNYLVVRWMGGWLVREARDSQFNAGDRVEVQERGKALLLTKYIGVPPGGRKLEEEVFFKKHMGTVEEAIREKSRGREGKYIYRTM